PGHGHGDGEGEHDHQVPPAVVAFDAARWTETSDVADELLFLWNGLPAASRVEVFLPGVRAEQVLNLRNARHAPGNVAIVDEHTLLLRPTGAAYLPLPPVPSGRVPGVVTITLP